MHVNRKQDIYYTMCTNARVSTYCIQLLIQSISRNDSKQIGNDQHLWKKKKWEDEKEKGDQNASTNEKFNVSCSCSCSCFETRYNGEYTGYIHTHTHIRTDMFTTRAIRSKSNWHKNIKKEIHFHFDHLTRNWNSFPNSKSIVYYSNLLINRYSSIFVSALLKKFCVQHREIFLSVSSFIICSIWTSIP